MKLRHIKHSLKSTPGTLRLTAACLLFASSFAIAQVPTPPTASSSTSPTPTFDVATIKPQSTTAPRNFFGVMFTPDGLNGSAATLYGLVQVAYGLAPNRVSGGLGWANDERYDIQAKMSGADAELMKTLSPAEQKIRRQLMLQALLADRFKLKTHSETKQVPTFDLVTTKDISKLKATDTDPNGKMNKSGTPGMAIRQVSKDSIQITGNMASFANFLSGPMSGVGRPVTDKTSLTSTYDFTLNWAPHFASATTTQPAAVSPDPSDDAASIFTVLKELGLKLQPSTGPIQTIVIDHAERPTSD